MQNDNEQNGLQKTFSLRDCVFLEAFIIWVSVFRHCFVSCMSVVVEANGIFVSRLFLQSLRSRLVC